MASMIWPSLDKINWIGEDGTESMVRMEPTLTPYPAGYTGVSPYDLNTPMVVIVATPAGGEIPPTPYPTYTPYPTFTAVSYLTLTVQYSYYWPPLLGPNCHPDNVRGGKCLDTTSSGLKWSEYRGRGVAIPLTWAGTVPLLSVVRVLHPVTMIGDYLVIDYCGACTKSEYPDLVWLDFLDDTQRLDWSADMQVQILPPALSD